MSRNLRAALPAVALFIALAGCAQGESGLADLPSFIGGQSEDALFQDTFAPGQTGRWLLEQDDLGSTAILNEQLVISVGPPNTIQYAKLEEPTFSDFVLEVDGRLRAGSPESTYGVLFRMADGQQFYRFAVTGSGAYLIERHDSDGSWTRFVPEWKPSPAINQGLNVANRLKVIASGSEMAFYVNDILLEQVSDSAYGTGAVALDAGTFAGGDVQVSFDDLTITGPTEQE